MTTQEKATVRSFVPETLLYGLLAAGFCFGVAHLLGRTLVVLFHQHPAEYGLLALGLIVFQGFVLERITHAVFTLFRLRGKARK